MSREMIPDSWTTMPIEDCLLPYSNGKKIRQGWSPQCENFRTQTLNDWGVLKTTAIQDGSFLEDESKHLPAALEPRTHLEVKSGDILITCAGPRARCGVTCLVRETRPKLLISGKMYQLRADPKIIDRRLLESFLREPQTRQKIDELKTGISESGLNLTHDRFKTLEVPLPPLAEQKRIAAKLEAVLGRLDACRARLDRVPALLKRFRQSVLAAAVSGNLTEEWRAVEGIDLSSWIELTLSESCVKITDGEHLSPPLTKSGTPLLSAKDVREWGVDFSDTKYVSNQFAETSRRRCGPELNDVLVVSRGATVGRTCLVATTEVFCLMGSVLLFKPDTKRVKPKYLASFLSSPAGLDRLTKASGATAQSAIYIRDAKELMIPIPSLPEQQEIVRRVEELFAFADRIEARLAVAQKTVDRLTPSVLAKAFRGELVPQDPNDEPASSLLARLQNQPPAKPARATRKPRK